MSTSHLFYFSNLSEAAAKNLIHCWLTNKINNPATINRASRIPTTNEITQCRLGLISFDPAPFCAAPRLNQKRRLPIRPIPHDEILAFQGSYIWSTSAGCSHLARRLSGPTLECMGECAHVIKAEQPRNLGYMQLAVTEVTNRQIAPQLLKYFSDVRDRGTTDTARDARATRMTSSPMRFCHR